MFALSIIFFTLLVSVLVLVAGAAPRKSTLSAYELHRRQESGSHAAADELRRLEAVDDIIALKGVIEVLFVAFIALTALMIWGWMGVALALVVTVFYRRIAKFEFIRVNAQRLYDELDAKIVGFVAMHPQIGRVIGGLSGSDERNGFGSREELEHMINESSSVLSLDEKKLLKSNLHFAEKTVEAVMTPRGVLEVIDAHEILGPIVLDQLHKTGHSRFPVMNGDIDHIVGVLHIRELLSLEQKASHTAEQTMEKKVYYINQSQTLQHALAAFLSTRHHLFVVVNEYRETAGIITLEDCLEALIGYRIVDEFDAHDDLRAVAGRNPKRNNNAPGSTNV